MHHANYHYGHAHVLARYCRLDDAMHPPRIHGYLQHGWAIGDCLAPDVPFVAGSAIFVWSERTRRLAWSRGRRDLIVIGSPFAYLLAMSPENAAGPANEEGSPLREGTIFYPFHGWEGQRVLGDHHRLIDELRATESGPITVCLYWQEHQTASIRRLYEQTGWRVICHGYRGYWWRDHNRRFLDRQLAELRRHRRVVSNRLCSAIWYGLLAGCEVAVYGDPMVLDRSAEVSGGEPSIRRQWSALYGYQTDRATALALARQELGADSLAEPEELRAYLGWANELRRTR